MRIPFTKMQGAGNDFVVFENLNGSLSLSADQIRMLCNRRFGIGADGLMLVEKPSEPHLDARMIYYNSDGSRGEMCGNGARCFTAFALALGFGESGRLSFLTDAGPMTAAAAGNLYTIQMTPPTDLRLNIDLDLATGPATVHHVNTGVPHAVRFVEDIAAVDVPKEGAELRHHRAFSPKGANINFAQIRAPGEPVAVRTYERGVEAETLACGTGVTAAALIAHLLFDLEKPVSVQVAGGDVLQVDFRFDRETATDVTLTGPAKTVFEGTVDLGKL